MESDEMGSILLAALNFDSLCAADELALSTSNALSARHGRVIVPHCASLCAVSVKQAVASRRTVRMPVCESISEVRSSAPSLAGEMATYLLNY